MNVASLHTMLPAGAADAAPEWVHLIPAGEFRGVDGRGPYRLRDAAAVIAASMQAERLPIDENHATDHALRAGGPAPARGWIVAMQAREDGVWGQVEWTPEGSDLVSGRAYRGLSPVFAHTEKGGQVLRVLRAGLTNAPNLGDLKALHTQETQVDLKAIRAALGLADDADEAAILAAATAARAATAAHTQQIGTIAKAAGLAENAAPDAIVTALQTRQAAGDPNQLAGQVVALQTQIATIQAEARREKAEAAVDAAIRAGKPIGSLRDHYIVRHTQDPVTVQKELDGMPSINAGGIVTPPKAGDPAGALDATDRQVVQLMGLDPEAYKQARAKQGLAVAGGV